MGIKKIRKHAQWLNDLTGCKIKAKQFLQGGDRSQIEIAEYLKISLDQVLIVLEALEKDGIRIHTSQRIYWL
jgi:biotin operon repressor